MVRAQIGFPPTLSDVTDTPDGTGGSGATSGSDISVRPTTRADTRWLLAAGWSPELIGTQYHWVETPLQAFIAPMRALGVPGGPSCIIERDGDAVGYIGRNPLSGNLEYWVQPHARGGVGKRALAEFLRWWESSGDRSRVFYISTKNDRSRAVLLGTLSSLGWEEGERFEVNEGRTGSRITVHPAGER